MRYTLIILMISLVLFGETQKLRYVVDGDTVRFKNANCRLAFIDSPESKRNIKAQKDVADCSNVLINDIVEAGRYSTRYLKSILIKGKTYEIDIIGRDRYEREICIIYSDGESVNEKIVKNGFAVPFWKYIKDPDVKQKMIGHIRHAKKHNKGIWRTHSNVMECMN